MVYWPLPDALWECEKDFPALKSPYRTWAPPKGFACFVPSVSVPVQWFPENALHRFVYVPYSSLQAVWAELAQESLQNPAVPAATSSPFSQYTGTSRWSPSVGFIPTWSRASTDAVDPTALNVEECSRTAAWPVSASRCTKLS